VTVVGGAILLHGDSADKTVSLAKE
jgi:hypothetical protein